MGELTLGKFLGGFIALVALIAWVTADSPSPQPVIDLTPKPAGSGGAKGALGEDALAVCRKIMAEAKKMQLVRAQPSPTRIDVEDATWALLPADDKRLILSAVGCLAFKQKQESWQTPGNPLGGHTVAYGYRSGKRLAMATSDGFSFE